MGNTTIFEKGEVIAFSTGEYSDYSLSGFLVTTKDCDLEALAHEYQRTYEAEDEWDKPDPGGFPSWLVAKGHAMPVHYSQLHLGSYGEFEGTLNLPSDDTKEGT